MRLNTFITALALIACCLVVAASPRKGDTKTASVTIKNFEFQPKTITVKPGATVTWTNEAGAHTVTADNDSFSSPTLSAGKTFSHKFTKKGSYPYHCTFHGGAGGHDMAGTVIVK